MTVWMVTCGDYQTLFLSKELAEDSVKQTRDRLVGGGYLGNLACDITEVVVHSNIFEVR